ncbi:MULTISPECIES: protein kinase domain-containing protein [unclassified Streptomyces]|uniref:serine/threonine-protein kinase n=1 Tax=unclassified Streptomyces TaxID=2593676 RepID=UPI002E813F67|nr:serine/threonine protein kinase [Streptomyces sp. NBC_00589]
MVKVQDPTGELVAGRYRLSEVVHREEGRDGWLGQDVGVERPVSLIRSRLPERRREEAERGTAARILRASERLALVCPGRVATVLDVIEDDDAVWTVTERPPGAPLTELLGRGPVNYVRAARIGLGLLDVLAAAHLAGVTHGDLSPGQVSVDERGAVLVSGFGLMGATSSPRVTAPSYASPEQARGEGTGPAADLWALGAIMYAMVEGRPPIRDRGRLDATLRAVDRLPIRAPLNAGPLGPAIQGLLRWDPLERVPEPVVREALTRILKDDLDNATPTEPLPPFQDIDVAARRAGRTWGGRHVSRPVVLGGALAVTVVCFAVLTAAGGLPDGDTSASGAAPGRTASGSPSAGPTDPGTLPQRTPSVSPTASPSSSPSPSPSPSFTVGEKVPSGFFRYKAPQGFSVDLPKGWTPVRTTSSADGSYRVTFGASGDPRTLAVTYSTQLGPDPVAVWSALEPSLRSESTGYERVGDIRAVNYLGHKGADMEWLSASQGVREHTYGRGFLIGDHRGFSLRWTTPADDWNTSANRRALDVFFQSFQPASR